MVHRPADSRLLTNLLCQEKDYTKHLNALLDSSHSSQASFSAYAAASSPPTSHVILAVTASLSGADDALRGYVAAVEEWREHLKGLKNLEDEVGNIMRDREILVTRLLKASKSHKPTRDHSTQRASLLHNAKSHPPSSSSLSLTSSLSLISASGPLSVLSSSKLTSAQSELQACEAHLASKERELTLARATAVREGLNIRLNALVQCGQSWALMGREGLHALEGLNINEGPPNSQYFSDQNDPNKPLPLLRPDLDPNHRPSSDISHSSLAPSQSASQIGASAPLTAPLPLSLPTSESTIHANAYDSVYMNGDINGSQSGNVNGDVNSHGSLSHTNSHTQIHIPPAHALGDFNMPSTSRSSSPSPFSYASNSNRNSIGNGNANANGKVSEFDGTRHVLTRRITEEDILYQAQEQQEGGSSVEELAVAGDSEMRIVENPRFAGKSKSKFKAKAAILPKKGQPMLDSSDHHQDTSSASEANVSASGTSPSKQPRARSSLGSIPSNSTGFFGSLRGIFSPNSGHKVQKEKDRETSSYDPPPPRKKNDRWATRTERNLKALRKDGSDDDGEDDPGVAGAATVVAPPPVASMFGSPPASPSPPPTLGSPPSANASRRLRKARGQGRSASVPPPTSSPGSAGQMAADMREASDNDGRQESEKQKRDTISKSEQGGSSTPMILPAQTSPARTTHPGTKSRPEVPVSLSRNSSIASAPVPGASEGGKGKGRGSKAGHKRPASISGLPSTSTTTTTLGTGHHRQRKDSLHVVAPAPMHPLSLMSVVEGSQAQAQAHRNRSEVELNWERWAPATTASASASGVGLGVGLGEVVKAPPRVGRREIMNTYGGGGPGMGVGGAAIGVGVVASPSPSPSPSPTVSTPPLSLGGVQMPVLRAPGSVFDIASGGGGGGAGMSSSMSALLPAVNGNGDGVGGKRPAKSPLRSALRNTSRSPSPSLLPPPVSPHREKPVPVLGENKKGEEEQEKEEEEDDAASISSYETGRETFFDMQEDPEGAETTPVPPFKSLPNGIGASVPNGRGHAHASGTGAGTAKQPGSDVSTAPEQGQQRRKSVRVSLKPTYAAMPPLVYDLGVGKGGGWTEPGPGRDVPDMWEDSSEEDVEYATARRMLARVGSGPWTEKRRTR